jgi:hypothetical protein
MTSDVSIHYALTGRGWSQCRVAIGDSRCDVTASYLSDALGELAAAVEDVLRWPGVDSRAVFVEEPGVFRWRFVAAGKDRMTVKIVQFSDWEKLEDSVGNVIFDAECDGRALGQAMAAELRRLLVTVGERSYREKWSTMTFPPHDSRRSRHFSVEEASNSALQRVSADDLTKFPVWEFALDDEGEEGQDESTVRPYMLDGQLDPSAGMFVARARFRLADGSQFHGYLTPPVQGDDSLGTLQPVIVTGEGQVLFWWGSILPPAAEVSQSYQRLGGTAHSHVFPIQFSSDVPILGGPIEGELPGFLHLEDWKTGRTKVVK